MKIIAILIVILLAGCSMVEIKPASDLAEKIIARRLAYEFGKKNPEMIDHALAVCEILIADGAEKSVQSVSGAYAIGLLVKYTSEDPLLKADVEDLLSMIEIKTQAGSELDMVKLKNSALGFKQGLEMAR